MYSKIKEMYFYLGASFACKWKNESIYGGMRGTASVLFTRKLLPAYAMGFEGFLPHKSLKKNYVNNFLEHLSESTPLVIFLSSIPG